MTPGDRNVPVRRRLVAVVSGGLLLLAGCLGGGGSTFDPQGPCTVDGKVAGAYPALEALVPRTLDDKTPTTVDSGRNCTDGTLGSLISHAVHEVRFAGATWDFGNSNGVTTAVFELPAKELPADWMAEFYEIGARTAKRTEHIETSRPRFDGAGETWRLDTLNELSLQSVVTWQDGPIVRVVLAASTVSPDASRAAHDDLVARAVAASVAAGQGASPSVTPLPPATVAP